MVRCPISNFPGLAKRSGAGKFQISNNVLDKWIISLLNNLIKNVTSDLENYDTVSAINKLQIFIDRLSTWYIRRSRDRVGSTANGDDKLTFYSTSYEVLAALSKLLAPITPFLSEEIYRNLTNGESVHLENWPTANEELINEKLEVEMLSAINLSSQVLSFRKRSGIRVRIPIRKLEYKGPEEVEREVLRIVLDEVNVYELSFSGNAQDYKVKGDTTEKNLDIEAGEAREIIRQIQAERKTLGTKLNEKVDVQLPFWPGKFEEDIKRKALVDNLIRSDKFQVIRKNA